MNMKSSLVCVLFGAAIATAATAQETKAIDPEPWIWVSGWR
jgi:hypothetical protein